MKKAIAALCVLLCLPAASSLAGRPVASGPGGSGLEASVGDKRTAVRQESSGWGFAQPVGEPRAALEERMARLQVPGLAVAVVDGGKLVWSGGYGAGITPDTLFQAGSISKTVAALTALRLAAQGRLDLDREFFAPGVTVARLLQHGAGLNVPGFPGYAPGTPLPALEQILSGSAPANTPPVAVGGLPGPAGFESGNGIGSRGGAGDDRGSRGGERGASRDRSGPERGGHSHFREPRGADKDPAPVDNVLVRSAPARKRETPAFVPVYAYSGGGTLVVQKALEEASGKPFADLARELVLEPLGMGASGFFQPLPSAMAAQAAKGHGQSGNELPGGFRVYPELAAAGLWTTARDLGALVVGINSLAGPGGPNAFLPAPLARRMSAEPLAAGCLWCGLGVFVMRAGGEEYLLHWGANAGYRALFLCRPSHNQGVAVLSASENAETLLAEVARAVAAAQGWPGFDAAGKRFAGLAAQDLAKMAGKYESGAGDQVEIASSGQTLRIKNARNTVWLPMYTEDGLEFRFADFLSVATVRFPGGEMLLEKCPGAVERYRRLP